MKIFALGGTGKICRESALDIVQFGDFKKLTIGDINLTAAKETAEWLNHPKVDYAYIDVNNKLESIALLSEYDLVIDGTTISLNAASTECIAHAGCHGINLNGFGEEYNFSEVFKSHGKIMVPGFGMTPGTTNMMAVYACDQMEKVNSVRVSHGAYRPIAFSGSITETTIYEYDPQLPGRTVFENGNFIQVPPFARPREIELPQPYGKSIQYIIPHSETFTLAKYLAPKEVDLIEVRGTWPKENMELIKTLYNYGFFNNTRISLNGHEFGIMEAIGEYLQKSDKGKTTELYGYSLHVEVEGIKNGQLVRHTLTHTHPASDGSISDWAGLRAYTRNVGIPMGIAAQLIAQGKYKGEGALFPEFVFDPEIFFNELAKRQILIHSKEEQIN
ncbi:MAG: saccharopine dehydrogenase NADP-binding domain-containing protein [Prolixibacteraceae bacterium]|nr:saccharopine dehydrogenase NADP-binding domain-containing protein [Prolixibacteraceae bacterium]